MAVRLQAIVSGRVQGVGFRYWVHHTVQRLGAIDGGVVRNLSDGTVEVEAEAANRAPLEALFIELHKGPAAAQVTAVAPTWDENATARYAHFRVG